MYTQYIPFYFALKEAGVNTSSEPHKFDVKQSICILPFSKGDPTSFLTLLNKHKRRQSQRPVWGFWGREFIHVPSNITIALITVKSNNISLFHDD